jgi:energy-coupling factor transporter ATP-binding protein EcfA2
MSKHELITNIMHLIDDAKKEIDSKIIRPEVVMLIGMTGSGKSTLISDINGVALESFLEGSSRKYKLRPKAGAPSLPGVDIGHSLTSCTTIPGVVSPPDKLFTYIDLPGFGDTREAAQDIANAYFRKAITEKAILFKIVLVISENSITEREGNLPKCLRDFANFIQGIDSTNPKILSNLQKAVCIAVTKVSDTSPIRIKSIKDTIAEYKTFAAEADSSRHSLWSQRIEAKEAELKLLKVESVRSNKEAARSVLNKFLSEFDFSKMPNMKVILEYVIKNGNFSAYTTPMEPCDKPVDEAEEISGLIEKRIEFVSKKEAGLGIRVSDENQAFILRAIDDLNMMGEELAKSIDNDIGKMLGVTLEKSDAFESKIILKIKAQCEEIKQYSNPLTLERFFRQASRLKKLGFSQNTIKIYEKFNEYLTFLADLLPKTDRSRYSSTKNWIKELGLDVILDKHINCAQNILNPPKVAFENQTLIIEGYQIRTSQIDEEIKNRQNIRHIEIRALHTVIVDNDLSEAKNDKCAGKLRGVNLSIIAPHIVVNGDRAIDLSGVNGVNNFPSKAANGAQGGHGVPVGEWTPGNHGGLGGRGADGIAGIAGTSAGNLVITCDTFSGKERLMIRLQGGNGGNGQTGGDGGPGGNGSDVHIPIPTPNRRDGFIAVTPEGQTGNGRFDQTWRLVGGTGGIGGDGGYGGQGGDAGKAGQCVVIVGGRLVDSSRELKAADGTLGANGAPGEPGGGGANGRFTEGVWHRGGKPDNGWNGHYIPFTYRPGGTAPSGNKKPATTSVGQIISGIPKQNFRVALCNYKLYQEREAIAHASVTGEFLHGFARRCDRIKPAELKVIARDLLEEANALGTLETLQRRFQEYHRRIDFAPFYYSLLAGIQDVALGNRTTSEERKVLEYLYVATLGSIARIHAAADNLLVVDVRGYVKNLVVRDFAALQRLQADQLRSHYQAQYGETIDAKIVEAEKFLDILKQDVNSRQDEFSAQIKKLTDEINAAIRAGSADLISTQNKRRELEEALNKQTIFGVIGLAIQGIGMMFPPVGPIVAGVVNAGLQMARDPSLENAVNFIGKAVEMKSQLGQLPTADKTTKHEADLFKKVQEFAKTVAPIVQGVRELLSQKHAGDSRLAELDRQIISINAYIAELDVYLKTVPKILGEYLEGMVREVGDFQTALQDKSLAALEFSKLEIRRFFEGMQKNVSALVGQFAAKEGFQDIVIKMKEAVDVSSNICMRIQDYRDHMVFANYIAHLHTAGMRRTDDLRPEYRRAVQRLDLALQQSVVQEAYFRAIAAIKQWSFPFAENFLRSIPDLETSDPGAMAHNLPIIMGMLNNHKKNLQTMDQAIMNGPFDTTLTRPFITWSYKQQPQKFESLLKGEKVTLVADISSAKLDAVKFKEIGIQLECKDDSDQAELNKLLKNFQVTLEHTGVSYYKYADKFYQIATDKPIKITSSFKIDPKTGNPAITSGAWGKMKSGDLLLSPYAVWMVNIEPLPGVSLGKNCFDPFRRFLPHLKISLVGQGSYVEASKVSRRLNLDKYYLQTESLGGALSVSSRGPSSDPSLSGSSAGRRAPAPILPDLPEGYESVNVPGDGGCLFWSAVIGLLLPLRESQAAFNTMFDRLFGTTGEVSLKSDSKGSPLEGGRIAMPTARNAVYQMLCVNDFNPEEPAQYQQGCLLDLVHRVFRNRVVDQLPLIFTTHEEQQAICEESGREWNDYLAAMRQPDAWGSDSEIRAIGVLAQKNISVHGHGQPTTVNVPGITGTPLYLVHVNAGKNPNGVKNHYNFGYLSDKTLQAQSVTLPKTKTSQVPAGLFGKTIKRGELIENIARDCKQLLGHYKKQKGMSKQIAEIEKVVAELENHRKTTPTTLVEQAAELQKLEVFSKQIRQQLSPLLIKPAETATFS